MVTVMGAAAAAAAGAANVGGWCEARPASEARGGEEEKKRKEKKKEGEKEDKRYGWRAGGIHGQEESRQARLSPRKDKLKHINLSRKGKVGTVTLARITSSSWYRPLNSRPMGTTVEWLLAGRTKRYSNCAATGVVLIPLANAVKAQRNAVAPRCWRLFAPLSVPMHFTV